MPMSEDKLGVACPHRHVVVTVAFLQTEALSL